jgi:chromosome segregation ATPase
MDPAKARTWQRFRDRVVSNRDWPRSLWLAAVEDALAAALGADSRLLADYRADVGELLGLERTARGSYHDERRIAVLEGRIKHLIELADETISETGAEVEALPAPAVATLGRHPGLRVFVSSGLGALLFVAGIVSAAAFHEVRLGAEVDRQMTRMDGLLDQRVAELRADLDRRLSVAERLNEEMKRRQDQFSANVDQLSATMAGSVRSMMALGDQTVSDLERRLNAHGGGVSEALGRLRTRADGLGRGFDDVGRDLSVLEERLPRLAAEVEDVAANAQRLRAGFERSAAAIDAVEAGTPALVARLEHDRGGLGQDLDERQAKLAALTTEVANLEGAVEQSRARLEGYNQALDRDLQQAKQDGAALESAIQDLHATGQQVAELMAGTEAKIQASHQEMQKKIDQILSQTAEKADLAVLRSQDVIRRAEGEVTRKLQGESQRVTDDLSKAREARLADLARKASATQVELEQSRAGLLASWQTMDQAVALRQSEVLTGLDGYAQAIQARVEDLLKALDVKVAGSDG